MKTLIAGLALVVAVSGCKTEPVFEPENNATVMLTAEAGVFMAILKKGGSIPEIPADRQGDLQSGMLCDPQSTPTFPFNASFRAIMSDAPETTYRFVVTKEMHSTPWTMSKAWKETAGNKIELDLPSAGAQDRANAELLRQIQGDGTANNRLNPISGSSIKLPEKD